MLQVPIRKGDCIVKNDDTSWWGSSNNDKPAYLLSDIKWEKDDEVEVPKGIDDNRAKFRDLIMTFLDDFAAKTEYNVIIEHEVMGEKTKDPSTLSVLDFLSEVKPKNEKISPTAFQEMLGRTRNLDVTDHKGKTPLNNAILNDKEEKAKILIEAGADVDHVYTTDFEAQVKPSF